MASKENNNLTVTEHTVRIAKNTGKKYNIMAFDARDRVDCSTWTQAQMERDMSACETFGLNKSEFKEEDQPLVLNVNGKEGRRWFKGQKRGGVTEHASYFVLLETSEGEFEMVPVKGWYSFRKIAKPRTPQTTEEAEEKWSRRNKMVNNCNAMLQKRLRKNRGEHEEEENGESGEKTKVRGRWGDLCLHDPEEQLASSSDDGSVGEEEENKKRKRGSVKGKGKKKRKVDTEALEDSDHGDHEGLEVDYGSDESSSEEESEKEEDVPKGIDEGSECEEESEEEQQNVEEVEEEEEGSSGESDRLDLPLAGGSGSVGGFRTSSCPGTPAMDSVSTSNTLQAAASKLEQGKRKAPGLDCPAAKRRKMEPSSPSPGPSGRSTPQPPLDISPTSSSSTQLAEKVIQRSLMRSPMTMKDIVKEFQKMFPGLSKQETIPLLAQILKKLKPEKKVINDKMHFHLIK